MSPESVFRDNSRPAIARYAAIHRAELTRIKRRSDVVDVSDEGFF
jgi:hypothetical protein